MTEISTKTILSAYKARVEELEHENLKLRGQLADIQDEIWALKKSNEKKTELIEELMA